MTSKRYVLSPVWDVPTLLGLLTVFGLLAALLGIGVWHWLAWLALAIPVLVILLCWVRPRKAPDR